MSYDRVGYEREGGSKSKRGVDYLFHAIPYFFFKPGPNLTFTGIHNGFRWLAGTTLNHQITQSYKAHFLHYRQWIERPLKASIRGSVVGKLCSHAGMMMMMMMVVMEPFLIPGIKQPSVNLTIIVCIYWWKAGTALNNQIAKHKEIRSLGQEDKTVQTIKRIKTDR